MNNPKYFKIQKNTPDLAQRGNSPDIDGNEGTSNSLPSRQQSLPKLFRQINSARKIDC